MKRFLFSLLFFWIFGSPPLGGKWRRVREIRVSVDLYPCRRVSPQQAYPSLYTLSDFATRGDTYVTPSPSSRNSTEHSTPSLRAVQPPSPIPTLSRETHDRHPVGSTFVDSPVHTYIYPQSAARIRAEPGWSDSFTRSR